MSLINIIANKFARLPGRKPTEQTQNTARLKKWQVLTVG